MNERFVAAVNRGSIRIYKRSQPMGQSKPALKQVEAIDLPAGRHPFTEYETDQAGRFPTSRSPAMEIDERLPIAQEQSRRLVREIAGRLDTFLADHPGERWDFAAPPGLQQAVLEKISAEARGRLGATLAKDLANVPAEELRHHFEHAGR